MSRKILLPALLSATALAAPAFAGNVIPVEVEPAPVVVTPAPVLSFAGGYAGGSLGYGFLDGSTDGGFDLGVGDDDDDDDDDDDVFDALDLDDGDVNYGLHAGYNFQNGSIVWGPELAIFGGEAEIGGESDDGDSSVSTDLDFGARLALRGGYAIGQNLIYGLVGASYLDLSADGSSSDDRADDILDGDGDVGYAIGFGYERLITDNFVVGAQYTLHAVEDIDLGNDNEIDVDYRTLELRGSFKF